MVFEFVFVKYVVLKKNIFNIVNVIYVILFFGGGGGSLWFFFKECLNNEKS